MEGTTDQATEEPADRLGVGLGDRLDDGLGDGPPDRLTDQISDQISDELTQLITYEEPAFDEGLPRCMQIRVWPFTFNLLSATDTFIHVYTRV